MIIKEAQIGDLGTILNLYATVLDKGETLTLAEAEVHFYKMMSYPNYKVFVAEQEHEIVGTFALLIMDNLAHRGSPSGVIEDVVVAQNYQGQGIGKKMMAFAMDRCKDLGCYKMVLSSNLKRTEAHQFYENLGFEKHGFSYRVDL